jgi:hypothetical protein
MTFIPKALVATLGGEIGVATHTEVAVPAATSDGSVPA